MAHRLNRLILLIRCLIRSVSYGPSTRLPQKLSRIIVVPTGKLGDVVCCTPVFAAVRAAHPEVHIIAAGNARLHRPLLADSGLVDEYLDLDARGALEHVRDARADAAILTGHSFDYAALFYLAGIPLIVGPRAEGIDSHEETRPYKMLMGLIITYPHQYKGYAPREHLRSLEPLGIRSSDTHKRLGFSQVAKAHTEKIIADIAEPYRYLIGISVGAGNKEKCWPADKFARVADHLVAHEHAHVVLIGSARDKEQIDPFLASFKDRAHLTNATHFSLDESKALISRLDLFISVNTGPLYIAEAFDVSTVDLIGPVNPWDQPPVGKIHKMVFAPGRPTPLLFILNSRAHDIAQAERIAHSTRVADVIAAVTEALRDLDTRRSPGR